MLKHKWIALGSIILLLGSTLLLSGCITFRNEIEIGADGSGTRTMIVAMDEMFLTMAEEGEDPFADIEEEVSGIPGAETEEYYDKEKERKGVKVTMPFADLDELVSLSRSETFEEMETLELEESNGVYTLKLTLKTGELGKELAGATGGEEGAEPGPAEMEQMKDMLEEMDLEFGYSIILANKIIDWSPQENGTLDATKNQITWEIDLFAAEESQELTVSWSATEEAVLAEAPPEEKVDTGLKVVAIFATPIEEPWDGCIHQALLKAEEYLGIEYEWTESVPYPDFERVVREYADKGFDLIMGDAFGSEEAVRRVARDYPEIAFCFGSGLGPAEPNFAVFDDWIHEPAYLSGMIAGKMTESNVIGVVGGYPVPEVNRIINAYIEGAREVNPDIKVKVTFIDSWFDPSKAKEAALAQIEAGVDVIYAERYGVIEAAAEKGIPAFGNMQDQWELAPDTVLTGPIWDMWPTVKHVVLSVHNDTFVAMDYAEWTMMAKGGAYLAPYHEFEDKLPAEVKSMVETRTEEILSGMFRAPVNEAVPVGD